MKGSYKVEISNNRVRYELTIKRNITIIRGNSGTGKSTMIRMVDDYYNNGRDSGIKLKCDVPCKSLHGRDWHNDLMRTSNSIVFIDDGNRFVNSDEFARAVQDSDNYFVIATRQPLSKLSYDINEIYSFSRR